MEHESCLYEMACRDVREACEYISENADDIVSSHPCGRRLVITMAFDFERNKPIEIYVTNEHRL